ncbi:hypothetical protein N566_17635 [Streptomycetaceae bacterium MP113-05]|nr:hypothetical protein N566_17635 [Streptomycetaceae bacterium MP113-05]
MKTNAKTKALRAGTLTAGTAALTALLTSPALAVVRDDGDDPGPGLSIVETLGLYVVAPVALFLVIAALIMVGDKTDKRRSAND